MKSFYLSLLSSRIIGLNYNCVFNKCVCVFLWKAFSWKISLWNLLVFIVCHGDIFIAPGLEETGRLKPTMACHYLSLSLSLSLQSLASWEWLLLSWKLIKKNNRSTQKKQHGRQNLKCFQLNSWENGFSESTCLPSDLSLCHSIWVHSLILRLRDGLDSYLLHHSWEVLAHWFQ